MKIISSEHAVFISDIDCISGALAEIKASDAPLAAVFYLSAETQTAPGENEWAELISSIGSLPYITAAAINEDTGYSPELLSLFDMVIPAETAEEYIEGLYQGKERSQLEELNRCFIAARNGSAAVMEQESRAFYRLMNAKNGEKAHE